MLTEKKFIDGKMQKKKFPVEKSTIKVKSCDESSDDQHDEDEMVEVKYSGSFNWRNYLRRSGGCVGAPVSCFKHVALSSCWDKIIPGVVVEVRSPDCVHLGCSVRPCSYWIATIIKVAGYWGLLRYEGFDSISPRYFNINDKWINLCTEPHVHAIGWCAKNKKPLAPPKNLEPKIICWKSYLTERLTGARTLPPDFVFKIENHYQCSIKKGMLLEVVDKNFISVVRSAVVRNTVGGRLHIFYEDHDPNDEGFWCHERSPLIHPVGWAQIIGHSLKASPEYARLSLKKTLYRTFDSKDATWDMFVPVVNPSQKAQFKKGMKLEAIDPLNLSSICVATVMEVLRNHYLMIGIDGMMSPEGTDWFCYHASSPYILPVGFCARNSLPLTPPNGYKKAFSWNEYLKETKAQPATYNLFSKSIPDHGFKEGMYLEAVDLMEPRLICVAKVVKVVGRLLKVHFEGWEAEYDQWCDCQSPDLFPMGWCLAIGYKLEPPRQSDSFEEKKKRKQVFFKGRRRKMRSKKLGITFAIKVEEEVGRPKKKANKSKTLVPQRVVKNVAEEFISSGDSSSESSAEGENSADKWQDLETTDEE